MSYKSHRKSPARAFDHLYDPLNQSSVPRAQRMNFKSLSKTAPLHIVPCYSAMFSDSAIKQRNFFFLQRNSLPISRDFSSQTVCKQTVNTNLFVLKPAVDTAQVFYVDEPAEITNTPRSVMCQTLYRESSAQTDLWLADAKLREGEMCAPEVLTVNCKIDPGIREVEVIERARMQREWENQLPLVTDKDFPLRIAQLKAFEWQKLVARERDLNEMQADRFEQVAAMIEDRQQFNGDFNQAMLGNVQKRIDVQSEHQKSKLQKSLARKLRNLHGDKFGKASKFDEKFEKSGQQSFNFKAIREEVMKSTELSQSPVSSKPSRDLWTQKPKLLRGLKPEKHLKVLFESVKQSSMHQKPDSIDCRKLIDTRELNDLNSDTDEECNRDVIEVQKTVKGVAVQHRLICGMNKSLDAVQDTRRQFKIDSVNEILPNDVEEAKLTLVKKVEFVLNEFSNDVVQPFVDEIVQAAENVAVNLENQKLLHEAEIQRRIHQVKELREKQLEERRREIKMAIENVQKKFAEKVLKNLLPSVVEMISEEDAAQFVLAEATKVDDEACRSSKNETEVVDIALRDFVVPEIESRVEKLLKPDDQIAALAAANDSLDDFLEVYKNSQ